MIEGTPTAIDKSPRASWRAAPTLHKACHSVLTSAHARSASQHRARRRTVNQAPAARRANSHQPGHDRTFPPFDRVGPSGSASKDDRRHSRSDPGRLGGCGRGLTRDRRRTGHTPRRPLAGDAPARLAKGASQPPATDRNALAPDNDHRPLPRFDSTAREHPIARAGSKRPLVRVPIPTRSMALDDHRVRVPRGSGARRHRHGSGRAIRTGADCQPLGPW